MSHWKFISCDKKVIRNGYTIILESNVGGGFRGLDWVTSPPKKQTNKHTYTLFEKQNMKKLEIGSEYYGRMKNKGKLSGQVPHCHFYFVA